MLANLASYLKLPTEITAFERAYLAKMNRVALIFFALHVPAIMIVAALAGTGALKSGLLTAFMLAGPLMAYRSLENPRHLTRIFAVTAMCMGGLLVHFGQGPMQIEMHFYFFVLLALLAIFADPAVILVAAATVTAHHLILYFVLPRSVFNYEASLWAVAVHALFVVLESAAACFVARSFFDSVIGLERIVQARTELLAERSRELRLMLDNTGQGFLTFDLAGNVAPERSAILARWFGECASGMHIWTYLGRADEAAGPVFEMGWEAVTDDVLPLELALAQMPRRMSAAGCVLELSYQPLFAEAKLSGVLLIISDVTNEVERERAEEDNRELVSVFESAVKDRVGFLEFMSEAGDLVRAITDDTSSVAAVQRAIHTLKGNCGLFGITGIARLCHEVEDRIGNGRREVSPSDTAALVNAWNALTVKTRAILGDGGNGSIEVDEAEHLSLVLRVAKGAPRDEVLRVLESWKLESTEGRLSRLGEQASALATRLNKEVSVRIESSGVRVTRASLAPVWTSVVHVIRNAIDHGIESPGERREAGKPAAGHLTLRTSFEGSDFVFSVVDDGRGIDWEQIRSCAAEKGLRSQTSQDLADALFAKDFSTRKSATEYSGRGVGLNAVRATCERMGGRVGVSSEKGRSTRLEIRVPRNVVDAPARS